MSRPVLKLYELISLNVHSLIAYSAMSMIMLYSEMEKIGLAIVAFAWWLLQVNARLNGSATTCKEFVAYMSHYA